MASSTPPTGSAIAHSGAPRKGFDPGREGCRGGPVSWAPSPRTTREPTLDEPLNPPSLPDGPPLRAGPSAVPPPEAPGLGEQIGATKDAATKMVGAHIELAKAEFAEIADAAKQAAVLVGIAVGAAIVAGLVVTVGLPLFLGEAIFGSIGWGILLGVLLLAALAMAAAVAALRPGVQASIGRPFIAGLALGVIVGVVLGLSLTNRAWTAVGDAILPTVDASYRPLLAAVAALAIVCAVLGTIFAAAAGGRGGALVGAFVGGAVGGVLLGFLTAFAAGPRVGAAIGVAVGLITWMALLGAGIARSEFNTDALKDRFWPAATIEATKETIEWARAKMPLSRRS